MISHKHKCIFIHIPKTAGTSINSFFHPNIPFNHAKPDYDRLYGWCPKRKLHLQHATTNELLELELITEEEWKNYFKFTFVRNPWDRAYSDYFWMMKDRQIKDSFKHYILRSGNFSRVLNDNSNKDYRGDHLKPQTDYYSIKGKYKLDFVGKFENFNNDISDIIQRLGIDRPFDVHENKGKKRYKHYSKFYNDRTKELTDTVFKNDIELLNYEFEYINNYWSYIKNAIKEYKKH